MHDHLERVYNDGSNYVLHYVTAREMYNIIKAAEAGRSGNPREYRDFAFAEACSTREACVIRRKLSDGFAAGSRSIGSTPAGEGKFVECFFACAQRIGCDLVPASRKAP